MTISYLPYARDLQAQVNALQAQADAQLSYYQLEKAAGLLNTDFSNQN